MPLFHRKIDDLKYDLASKLTHFSININLQACIKLKILTMVPIKNPITPKIIKLQFLARLKTEGLSLVIKSKPAGITRPSIDVVRAPPNDTSKSIRSDIAAKPSGTALM